MTEHLSSVVSVRVLPGELAEFEALVREVGADRTRMLRNAFAAQVVELRAQANKRRTLHSLPTWESEWQSRGENDQ